MQRTPFICGNWKLNHSLAATQEILTQIRRGMVGLKNIEAAIAPVTTCLSTACEVTSGETKLGIAAQNVFWAEKGAYTGEWSVAHLKELGCKYAIIGHSERRQYFAESDEAVGKKVRATLDGGLIPIACVGESLEEREGGKTMQVIQRQTAAVLAVLEENEVANLVLAYEPVWAIGTGKTASAAQAQEVHAGIRQQIRNAFGDEAEKVRIQYGGSVKPANAAELLAEKDVDGALVGGASLDAENFLGILKAAANAG